jgi:hypothetical protein
MNLCVTLAIKAAFKTISSRIMGDLSSRLSVVSIVTIRHRDGCWEIDERHNLILHYLHS